MDMMISSTLGRVTVFAALLVGSALMASEGARAGSAVASGTEVRIGTFYHGYQGREAGTADIAIDALLPAFDLGKSPLTSWFSLHPQIGADLNTQGKTSAAFAGFAGVVELPGNMLIEGDLGGSINNGKTTSPDDTGRAELGCTALFREALGIGFRFSKQTSVMAVAEHMSNANLCAPNNGITNFGLRFGYNF